MPMALVNWFNRQKRDFPWREDPTPYSVWISEVMLQQTQASVVVPYFLRWMERFPTIQALAESPLEEVTKLWEGLGYYSRARNLHAGAKYIVKEYGGILPSDRDSLLKIKGLGPYTTGAILAFAFKLPAVAVDGNVLRAASRLFAIQERVDLPKTQKEIEKILLSILPNEEPWVFTEAMIELGATVCKKIPDCDACPVRSTCKAKEQGLEQNLPIKKTRPETIYLTRRVFLILSSNGVLVREVPKGEVMAGLYEFPYLEEGEDEAEMLASWGLKQPPLCRFPSVQHTFTRYKAKLEPKLYYTESKRALNGYQWVKLEELNRLPFSSGHRRLLHHVKQWDAKKA